MLVTCIISVVLTKQAVTEAVHHIDEVNVIRIGDAVMSSSGDESYQWEYMSIIYLFI